MDMTPWEILPGETGDDGLIPHFWWQFFAHPLSEIHTKTNIKETESKGNIWGTFYIPKDEGLGGG